jgi:2',3'-cyclic-nucleotide 2'-phosphodiesterase
MKILFIGDIFGDTGRRVLAEHLRNIVESQGIDLCIANGENTSGGRGLTGNLAKKLRKYGVHVITGGNHSFTIPDNDTSFMELPYVLRPLNFPSENIGHGSTLFTLEDGRTVGVVNLQGRTFHRELLDCPFRTGRAAIDELRKKTNIIVVDFHAETTSEKLAFATYVDGTVSAVIGTHTHVQTSDERVLKHGTAFLSDAGMTGPEDSIIGMKADGVLRHFVLQTHVRFEPSSSGPMLNAVIIDVDDKSGSARGIFRIFERVVFA